jgi:hypothetical protein
MKSILDPSFRYVSSLNTDLRATFARIRRELQQKQAVLRVRTRHAADVVVLRPGRAR